jgi:hypothetical protein
MAFDISTARPIEEVKKRKFDITTARPIGNLKDVVEAGIRPIEKGKGIVDKVALEMTERARREKELKELPKLDWEKPAIETLGEYDKGLEHDPIIESVAMPVNAIRKGLMSVGGIAILEGLGQAKNYGVSKIKG